VLMNSVDTGWVTDERNMRAQLRRPEGYPKCLYDVDGAARVLFPVWRSLCERQCDCCQKRIALWRATRKRAADDDQDSDDSSSDVTLRNANCWACLLPFNRFGVFLKVSILGDGAGNTVLDRTMLHQCGNEDIHFTSIKTTTITLQHIGITARCESS
jgi:hypothetical protein